MTMGLLKSVDNVQGVDYYEYRDSLYYNKYEYRLRLNVPGARYTYWCKKPEDLDKKLAGKGPKYSNVKTDDIVMVTQNLPALKEVVNLYIKRKADKSYSLRLEGNTLSVFANDLAVIDTIKNQIGLTYSLDCTHAQTVGFSGTRYFVKEPKHKYRVYLRSKRVDDNFHNELRNFFSTQKKLYPSSALRQWYTRDGKHYGIWYFRWTSAAHYIDYDDESTLSYLALMYGEVLGKKYKLEKKPDNI